MIPLAVIVFWAATLISLPLAAMGAERRQRRWLVAAAVLLLPWAAYLGGSPGAPWGWGLPLVPLGAALVVRRSPRFAWTAVALQGLGIVGPLVWVALAASRSTH